MLEATPAPHKLAVAIFGALLFPLTIINSIVGLVPFPRTLLQFLFVIIVAILCIGYGRGWRRVRWAGTTVRLIAYSPFIALVLAIVLLQVPVQPLGRHEARRDLANGDYKVAIGIFPWSNEAKRLLSERYGITSTISGGCLTTVFESTYRAGYSSVMRPAIREKYGRDVVTETVEEARASWRAAAASRNRVGVPVSGP